MKWFGEIGFSESVEVAPGVWDDQIVKRNYKGDLIKNFRRQQSTDKVTDDITLNNQISIIADPYATLHFQTIKYATYRGTAWKVNSIDVQYPRLILSLGGVYNE